MNSFGTLSSDIEADTVVEDDFHVTLRVAREHRDRYRNRSSVKTRQPTKSEGSSVDSDLSKAYRFYSEVVDRANPNAHRNHDLSRSGSRVYLDAVYELSQLLEEVELRELDDASTGNGGGTSGGGSRLLLDIAGRPRKSSFDLLMAAADAGHMEAQHKLAAAYGTGVYTGLVPMDAGRSLLLEMSAASSGHPEANLAMGYRYLHGIGVQQSCEHAKVYYEFAANHAYEQISQRGYALFADKSRPDEDSGAMSKQYKEVDEETVDFYARLAEEGDSNAAMTLGSIFMQGSRHVPQDFRRAIHFLNISASRGGVPSSGMLAWLQAREIREEGVPRMEPKQIADLARYAANRGDVNGKFYELRDAIALS